MEGRGVNTTIVARLPCRTLMTNARKRRDVRKRQMLVEKYVNRLDVHRI